MRTVLTCRIDSVAKAVREDFRRFRTVPEARAWVVKRYNSASWVKSWVVRERAAVEHLNVPPEFFGVAWGAAQQCIVDTLTAAHSTWAPPALAGGVVQTVAQFITSIQF